MTNKTDIEEGLHKQETFYVVSNVSLRWQKYTNKLITQVMIKIKRLKLPIELVELISALNLHIIIN